MSRIQQLSQCLVEKYGLSEREAETFVTTLFEIIREKLLTDKIVKVKGLGTFKLAEMNARESVDVNTGERITIEGRYKLSFTPENAVRDRINSPFASFESMDMDDDVDFSEIDKKYDADTATTEETVEEAATSEEEKEEIPVEPVSAEPKTDEPVSVEPASVEPAPEQPVSEEPEPIEPVSEEPSAEPSAEPEPEELVSAEPEPEKPASVELAAEPEASPVQAEKIAETAEAADSSLSEELIREDLNHNKTIITLLRWVLGVVILILVCIGAHFAYNVWHDNGMKQNNQPKPAVEKPNAPKKEVTKAVVSPDSVKDTVNVAKVTDKKESAEDSIAKIIEIYNNKNARVRTGAYNIIGTKEIVTVRQGQTLKGISKATLGEDMTCYIEVYNDGITSVKAGDKIKIPQLELKKKRKKK